MEQEKRLTPVKAIRAKCIDCCCGQLKEVRLCTVRKCPLYLYRMGTNPFRVSIGSGQQVNGEKSLVEPEIFPVIRIAFLSPTPKESSRFPKPPA
jgi:hypothetical protein